MFKPKFLSNFLRSSAFASRYPRISRTVLEMIGGVLSTVTSQPVFIRISLAMAPLRPTASDGFLHWMMTFHMQGSKNNSEISAVSGTSSLMTAVAASLSMTISAFGRITTLRLIFFEIFPARPSEPTNLSISLVNMAISPASKSALYSISRGTILLISSLISLKVNRIVTSPTAT